MVLLPVISYGVLRSSRVQTILARRVATYLSEELQTSITVGGLDVSFFLNVVLEDVQVNDQDEYPLLVTRRMVLDIERISLRPRFLSINKIYLEQAFLGAAKYAGHDHYNFQFILDYFSPKKDPDARSKWDVICKSLEFKDSGFQLHDQEQPVQPTGFDHAHIDIRGFNLAVNDIILDRDTLIFNLEQLSLHSTEDFQITGLSGKFHIAPDQALVSDVTIQSPLTDLSLDLALQYEGYHSFSDFINQVRMQLKINDSYLDMADMGFFLSSMYGMKGRVEAEGDLTGTVSNLKGDDLLLQYGSATRFQGSFHLDGLPVLSETFVNFFITEFSSHPDDIASLQLPLRAASPHPVMPATFHNLGNLSFQGRLTGFVNDFFAQGQMTTDIGRARAELQFKRSPTEQGRYKGNLQAMDFDLGAFFDRSDIMGATSFNAVIEGKGFDLQTIAMDFSGEVEHLNLANYDYQNLKVEGEFTERMFDGFLVIEDDNLQLNFNGLVNLENQEPVFDFHALIAHANLSRLNIYQRDSMADSGFSADISLQAQGGSIEKLIGSLRIADLSYYEMAGDEAGDDQHKEVYFTEDITLINEWTPSADHHLSMRSGFLEADLHGKILFHRLKMSSQGFAATFLPALIQQKIPDLEEDLHQDFTFDLRFKNTQVLSGLFFPQITIAPDSRLTGGFDNQHQEFYFHGAAPQLQIWNNRFVNWQAQGRQQQDSLMLEWKSQRMMMTDSIFIEHLLWRASIANDSLGYSAGWNNLDSISRNDGYIQGQVLFGKEPTARIRFLPSFAYVDDALWQIKGDNEIILDSAGVEVRNLVIRKEDESFKAHGFLTRDPEAFLHLSFENFNVNNFDFFLKNKKLEFAGVINGDIALSAVQQTPNIHARLDVSNFGFNGDHLGDLNLNSRWDHQKKGFQVDAHIVYYGNVGSNTPLVASGYFFPDRHKENFDLDIQLENLKMSIFSRYFNGFAQNFRGMASGALQLNGPLKAPELSGTARLVRTGFRIGYLNTSYTFAHQVEIGKDHFRFNNLLLNDTLGNSATASGSIYHNNFKDFSLNITLQPENMVMLNTTAAHNDLYYGKAFVTGRAHIHGPVKQIVMDISARTNRGTQIFLPLGYSGEVVENNFITFISKDTTWEATPLAPPELSGVALNFDLEVTPEAEVQLIFDSQIGDIIRGRGTGNLKFEITSLGSFNMYGDYVIEQGDYLFTLQNLINKRFNIRQGGSIRWAGDPYDADIDLTAAYRLRTPLYDLMMEVDSSDTYRRRVPVETILVLKDKLFNPTITFDINLPGGDETIRETIGRLITTEQEMNRQVFSLLVLNRFMPTSPDQYNTALGYGVGSTSSELLSNQLSNWLSQISNDFDIGVNYRPGDEISSQELEVALSTQLFDDRVTIDGNIGVAGNHPASQRTSTLIGDVVVEIKITPEGKFRVKAFNRSNTFDLMNTNSPYTQGVGIFYRKEFDSLGDLLRNNKKGAPDPAILPEEETGLLEE